MKRQKIAPYLFIAPFYTLFFVFTLGPIVFSFYAGLTKWQGLAPPVFAGFKNYINLLTDETFRLALANTLWYSAIGIFVVMPLALFLAGLLNTKWLKARGLFRAIYFMPVATCALVIGIVFKLLYDYNYGLLNWALVRVGLEAIPWTASPVWFKPAVAGMIVWHWTGNHMLYFLAGLQSISKEMYNAAKIDGASAWQCFRYITLPLLKPTILFVAVIMTITSFQTFEEPYILLFDARGFGGPLDSGLSLAMYLYRVGFRFLRRGYASAIGGMLFVVVFVLALLQTKYFGLFRENIQ